MILNIQGKSDRIIYLFAAIVTACCASAVSAATVDVYVSSCVKYPPKGLRGVLIGEQVGVLKDRVDRYTGEVIEKGTITFTDVPPGKHKLIVYGDRGDIYLTDIETDSEAIELNVLICVCPGAIIRVVKGSVTDPKGNPAVGSRISVPSLFIETLADEDGYYEMKVPPGSWEFAAHYGGERVVKEIDVEPPESPGSEPEPVYIDLIVGE